MKRIFLAEDKPNIIESLKFLLLHAGFDVHVATDGWQALEQAFHQHLNVLFLGVMLPKLDGHEVL